MRLTPGSLQTKQKKADPRIPQNKQKKVGLSQFSVFDSGHILTPSVNHPLLGFSLGDSFTIKSLGTGQPLIRFYRVTLMTKMSKLFSNDLFAKKMAKDFREAGKKPTLVTGMSTVASGWKMTKALKRTRYLVGETNFFGIV